MSSVAAVLVTTQLRTMQTMPNADNGTDVDADINNVTQMTDNNADDGG